MLQSEVDLNSIDDIQNVVIMPQNYTNYEELEANEDIIKNQYINFNNLGVNLIDDIDLIYHNDIYANMINYINNVYLTVVDYDSSAILPQKNIETGKLIYLFVCVDCFNTILPNFLNQINCTTLESFDSLIQNRYKGDYSVVKANLVKVTQQIVDELLKLQKLNPNIQKDIMFQKLLQRYSYYLELVDFGDTEKFVNNYIRPLLLKNIDSVLWRTT